MAFDHLKDLLAEIVLLKQVLEGEDRGLMRDPITDHVDPSEASHGRYLNQRILHRWIAQVVPLLLQMDPQQPPRGSQGLPLQRIRRATVLAFVLG